MKRSVWKVLDWKDPAEAILEEEWDWVIGADLVYSMDPIEDLINVLERIRIGSRNCRLVFAHKCRDPSIDHVFINRLKELNVFEVDDGSSETIKILKGRISDASFCDGGFSRR